MIRRYLIPGGASRACGSSCCSWPPTCHVWVFLLSHHTHSSLPSQATTLVCGHRGVTHVAAEESSHDDGLCGALRQADSRSENTFLTRLLPYFDGELHTDPNPFDPFTDFFPRAAVPATSSPATAPFYSYPGSLTEPPCTEDVQWMVFVEPVSVSPGQVNVLKDGLRQLPQTAACARASSLLYILSSLSRNLPPCRWIHQRSMQRDGWGGGGVGWGLVGYTATTNNRPLQARNSRPIVINDALYVSPP